MVYTLPEAPHSKRPATVTGVNNDGTVNLFVMLDRGNAAGIEFANQGDDPGQWNWPPKA